MTAPWAPSRTRSRDPTRSWAARSRPRGTTRWRRASSSQSWAGGTPTAVPDIAERHCLSIGTSPPVPAFLLPSHLPERGGGLETFPPLPSPSLLTKRWLSASNLGITATSSSAITPRQEGDISQPNIFFSSGRRGPDLRESHHFLHKRMLQPLPHPCSLGGNGFQLLCTSTSLTVAAPATPRGSVKSHRDRRFPWSPLLGCRGAAIPNSSCWGSKHVGRALLQAQPRPGQTRQSRRHRVTVFLTFQTSPMEDGAGQALQVPVALWRTLSRSVPSQEPQGHTRNPARSHNDSVVVAKRAVWWWCCLRGH